MSTKKYRPYFTLPELSYITIQVIKEGSNPILERYLKKYISDIKEGFKQENHTLKPSIEEKLGFTDSSSTTEDISTMEILLAQRIKA
jgi:hypothetical protein